MIRGILAMNNEAVVSFLQLGRYEMSISLLHKTLEQLYEEVIDSEDHTRSTSQVTLHDLSFKAIPLDEDDSAVLLAASPSNMFTVYPVAFTIKCNRATERNTSLGLYIALLFNKGLAHHLRGLRHPTACQRDLHEAIRYYRLGLELVRQNVSLSTMSNAFYLVCLALLNNAGHIFCHFLRSSVARSCLDSIETLLQACHSFDPSLAQTAFFHSIVLLSKSYNITVAPAA